MHRPRHCKLWLLPGWIAIAFIVSGSAAEEPVLQRYTQSQPLMGSTFTITVYAAQQGLAERAIEQAFGRIAELNQMLSDYEADSELNRLSRQSPTSAAVPVSDELFTVLAAAQVMSERTDGAFDVTVGPLTKLWRRARRQQQLPDDARFHEALAAVGYRFLVLDKDQQAVSLKQPDMRLDLGGIAKGYAVDEALRVLRSHGITRALVDGGGDIGLGDPPPDQVGWRIGVAALDADAEPSRFLRLHNCAVATSGDAWQYVEIQGTRYSHILNPHTGLGLTYRSSVTVVAGDCTTADSLASALSVLTPDAGVALLAHYPGSEALLIRRTDGQPQLTKSCGWDALQESN